MHVGSHSAAPSRAQPRTQPTSATRVGVLGLAVFLVVYGNLTSFVRGPASPEGGWLGVALGVFPAVVALVWARAFGLLPSDLGLVWRTAPRSAALGLVVALGLALVSVVFLRLPILAAQPVAYNPLNALPLETVLLRAFFWMPIDTAIPEEIEFRGALLAGLRLQVTTRRAVILSAVVFTLWHLVIVSRTLLATNFADEPLLLALGLVGALAAIFVGGVLFAILRLRTNNLAGSIICHWAFNTVLLIGIYTPSA